MLLKNFVDEVLNNDFVMQRSIGSKTKHFHTIDHLRPLNWFCGDCQLWPNQQISHMAQFWIQHQFRLEVYQIFFKKLIHHLQSIIFHIHHLFSFSVLGSPKWVWSPKKLWTSWNRFGVKWSLKYHLSICQYEVTHEMTPKSRKVKTSIDNNHLIYLSDHLSDLLKWKYEVRAF